MFPQPFRAAMFSSRNNPVREKRFLPPLPEDYRRGQHSQATLTDDHTLFLLNQLRERRSRVEGRSWFSRLFRRP